MAFANERTELRRLLLLAAAVLFLELALLPGMMFKLLAASTEWSVPLQLLVLFLAAFYRDAGTGADVRSFPKGPVVCWILGSP